MSDRAHKIASNSRASQYHEELEALLQALEDIDINVVLEIGVHKGYSLEVWEEYFSPVVLIGIETEDTVEVLKENVVFGDSSGPSTRAEVIKRLGDNKVDMLFIDGDHTLEGVSNDWSYCSLVRPGGVVVLHDIGKSDHPLVKVHEFWSELKETQKWQEIHFGGMGVGIIFL